MIRSVTRQATFAALSADGTRLREGSIRVTHLPSGHQASSSGPGPAVAFALNRRFGNAVDRNRARRRLREAFGEAQVNLPLPGDYLIGASREVLVSPYTDLVSSFRRCFQRLGAST